MSELMAAMLMFVAAIISAVFVFGGVPDPTGAWAVFVIGLALIATALIAFKVRA